MEKERPRIAILYLSYHCEPYIDDVIDAIAALTYPKEQLAFVVIDNPHPEYGSSAPNLREKLQGVATPDLPEVTILAQAENRGFSHGINVGIEWAIRHGFDYAFLHNDDGVMSPDAIEPLVATMEAEPEVGIAQSLILLDPERDLINSAGNALHYCFFGFCESYRESESSLDVPPVKDIAFASGAAALLRISCVEKCGKLDEDFFLYCEDLEYCCRLRLTGHRVVMVSESRFFHRYQFDRNNAKMYWIERNRYAVMLVTLRLPTLVVLLPIAAALEIGLFFFAWRRGWLATRFKVYGYWLQPSHWRLWWRKRRRVQKLRCVSDRDLLRLAVPRLEFQEQVIKSRLLDCFGNPLMALYYHVIVRSFVWW